MMQAITLSQAIENRKVESKLSKVNCQLLLFCINIWAKVFKNGPSKICGRQPLKKFTWSILEYLDLYLEYLDV